jgi:hypothetical protein
MQMNTDGNKVEGKIVSDKRNKDVYFLVLSVIRKVMVAHRDAVSKCYVTIQCCDANGKIFNSNHKLENLIEYQPQP